MNAKEIPKRLFEDIQSMICRIWKIRIFRFIIVGGLNTLVGYSLFVLFLYLGFHYSIAACLSTVLGVLFNFKSTGRIVFGNSPNSLLFRFILVYGTTYVVNVVALRFFREAGVNLYIAGAVLLVPMSVWSFYLNKIFVFNWGEK